MASATSCEGTIESGRPPGEESEGEPGAGGRGTEGDEGAPGGPGADACRPPAVRLWQLTPRQLARTLENVAPDAEVRDFEPAFASAMTLGHPFTADATIENGSTPLLRELVNAARDLADAMVRDGAGLPACAAEGSAEGSCLDEVIRTVAGRAWRRPPSVEEVQALHAFHTRLLGEEGSGPGAALGGTLRRLLASPQVLFRSELGAPDASGDDALLTPHELADYIAYTLTDAPPDDVLRAAEDAGELDTAEGLANQVRRLVGQLPGTSSLVDEDGGSPPRLSGLYRFLSEWIGLDDLDETSIATELGERPEGDPIRELGAGRIRRWLSGEPLLFAREVFAGDGRLASLLAGDETVYGDTLADFYGAPTPGGEALERGMTRDGRRGVVMMGGFLAAHPTTSRRGRWIRERLLCQPVPDPPAEVDNNLGGIQEAAEEEAGAPLSPREVRAQHLGDAACMGCHGLIDPVGYPFDDFDRLGQPREEWPGGYAIETAGEVTGTSASDRVVEDGAALMTHLADSPDVRDCFVEQLFTFVHGRPPEATDACVLRDLRSGFEESGGDIHELLVAMLSHDSMRLRRRGGEDR